MNQAAEDIARFQPEQAPIEQEKVWLRQKSEPARWFLRFVIYRNLGKKRSLRAALDADSGASKAVKGDGEGVKNVSIPGSWSRASKLWHWKERAEAWDMANLLLQGKLYQQSVGDCEYASRVTRIRVLDAIIGSYVAMLQEQGDAELHIEMVKLVQSLMKQIVEETRMFEAVMDPAVLDGHVAQYLSEHHEERKAKQEARARQRAART